MNQKTRFVALLRGINVGGKNKLPMTELAELFTSAGCAAVRTYIQSGNVVFTSNAAHTDEIIKTVEAAIESHFGFLPPIVLRTLGEMNEVITRNPYWSAKVDEELLHVMFLRDLPEPERVADLEPGRSAPDSFTVRGREIYLCLPHGAGRTKLSNAYFDSKLATISTSRNWRTVNSLCDLLKMN